MRIGCEPFLILLRDQIETARPQVGVIDGGLLAELLDDDLVL